jgi:glycosyltransferase involved in cell wall biosynthesis
MLKAIVDWFAGRQDVDFVVQILRPRGYTHGEETSFELLVATARKLKNVTFVDGSLSPHEFDELLDQIDCMICPYDPRHYHNRASLVFTQAAAVGIPCIVSRATSMMQQIHRGLAAGIDFVIDEDDCDGNAKRLAIAIDSVHEEQLLLKERAKLLVPKVIDYHCAKRYVELIMQRHPPL